MISSNGFVVCNFVEQPKKYKILDKIEQSFNHDDDSIEHEQPSKYAILVQI
jgi:hypothetical protein